MSCRSTRSPLPSITARTSTEEKERFASLAAARELSESALALSAIRAVIGADTRALHSHPSSGRVAATDRLTIRLRPGDGQLIARRAEQRGMRVSAYVAALVRAHVAAQPLLPANGSQLISAALASSCVRFDRRRQDRRCRSGAPRLH